MYIYKEELPLLSSFRERDLYSSRPPRPPSKDTEEKRERKRAKKKMRLVCCLQDDSNNLRLHTRAFCLIMNVGEGSEGMLAARKGLWATHDFPFIATAVDRLRAYSASSEGFVGVFFFLWLTKAYGHFWLRVNYGGRMICNSMLAFCFLVRSLKLYDLVGFS